MFHDLKGICKLVASLVRQSRKLVINIMIIGKPTGDRRGVDEAFIKLEIGVDEI